jgi:hypothetical protein
MFIPKQKRPPTIPAAQTLTLPAPVGGLNARDALAAMPQTDAVTLDNFFPSTTSVNLRNGSFKWSTGYPAAVESLMAYNAGSGSKLFAASGTGIYDATVQGAVGAPVITGLTSARWQHVNVSTPGGKFLYAVNGEDNARIYNGTTWLTPSIVGGQSITKITYNSSIAQVTTYAPHGLSTGSAVTLSGVSPAVYNGSYKVTVTGPSTFTYDIRAQAILSLIKSNAVALVNTGSAHGLSNGTPVTMSGNTEALYNGTFTITVTSPTQFGYNVNLPTVSTITRVTTTATLTTASPHGLSTGNSVTVSGAAPALFNGTFTITVTSPTQFTYTMGGTPASDATTPGSYVVNIVTTSITRVGTLATLTTSTPHNLVTGNTVLVSGATPADFNGTYVVTVLNPTQYTYTMSTTPASNATVVGTQGRVLSANATTIGDYALFQRTVSISNLTTTAVLVSQWPHNLNTGDSIEVTGATPAAYNGQFSVTVADAFTLNYTMLSDPGGVATVVGTFAEIPPGDATVLGSYTVLQRIVSMTNVGTTATVTTLFPHGLQAGNQVTIFGSVPVAYNGTFLVTPTGPTTFTYTMASTPVGSATTQGTMVISPALVGIDPTKAIQLTLYANRIFFVEQDSLVAWYLPANAIGGTALQFDLGPLMTLGGSLQVIATWTVDNAAGVQEYICFVSTEGEVLMYTGNDPANANSWAKAGHFYVGRPVGRRCIARWGSDMIIITTDGFIPLSKALLTDRSQLTTAISDKISNLVSYDTGAYFNNFGWQAIFYPAGDKMVVNIPQITNTMQYQYVMNTITGAWCRFTGWNSNVFEVMGNDLYFGSDILNGFAYVSKADTGFSDDGAYIFGEAKTAFQYFGYPGRQKHISMAQPIFNVTGDLTATLGIDMDFTDSYPAAQPSFTGSGGTLWNTALWNTFPWSPGVSTKTDWQGLTGVGDAGALHMRIVNNRSLTSWQAVTYVFRLGGVL